MKIVNLLATIFILAGFFSVARPQSRAIDQDSMTFNRVHFQLGKTKELARRTVAVPLAFTEGYFPGMVMHPFTFGVMFDTDAVRFDSMTIPAGSALEGIPIAYAPIAGGLHFDITAPVTPQDTGILAYLHFTLQEFDDTTCIDLDLLNWRFSGGMLFPVQHDGEICIIPLYPLLNGALFMPRELSWSQGSGDYAPNPFIVKCSVLNTGSRAANNSLFRIDYNRADFTLISPTAYLQQGIPADVDTNSMSDASWLVRANPRPVGDTLSITVVAMFDNHKDISMTHKIWIPPVEAPHFACKIDAPDTLRLNASGTGVEPNPFTVRYTITNIDTIARSVTQVQCSFQNDGLSLDPSVPGNTQTRNFNILLNPGDTTAVEWVFNAAGRIYARDLRLLVMAIDSEGDTIVCEKTIYVEPLPTGMSCSLTVKPAILAYDSLSQSYPVSSVEVTATLRNTGAWNLTNITAEIRTNDAMGILEFDPSYPNNNPETLPILFQGQDHQFSWGYRLGRPNTSGVDRVFEFCITYGSAEIPMNEGQCCAYLVVEPVSITGIEDLGTPAAGVFSLSQNYPNPFSSFTDISYSVGEEADVSLTVHNILGRRVAVLAEGQKKAGQYTARFDPKGLPGGVYVVRLNAGMYSKSRAMLLQR